MPVPAIILAAGASRRLGQPKQLVRIGAETLLARTIHIVSESGASPILVVLGANHESVSAAVDLSHVQTVLNPDWEQGIASSIHAGIHGLLELDPKAPALMLLVCDQPRLTQQHLRALIEVHKREVHENSHEAAGSDMIVASRYAGITGIPAIFPASQFATLLSLTGDTGARSLLRNPLCALVAIEFDGGEIDIDTLADLAAAPEI